MAVATARHNGIVTPLMPDTLMKNYGCGQCGKLHSLNKIRFSEFL